VDHPNNACRRCLRGWADRMGGASCSPRSRGSRQRERTDRAACRSRRHTTRYARAPGAGAPHARAQGATRPARAATGDPAIEAAVLSTTPMRGR